MKAEDIKRLYGVSPKLHKSIEYTLQQLDNTSVERYKKRKTIRRFIIAFAVIASVVAFSTVAYATNLFGLLTEPVGKYGLNMHVVKESTLDTTEKPKNVRLKLGYIPDGYEQIKDENGVTEPNKYSYGGKPISDRWGFSFLIYTDADSYNVTETYIIQLIMDMLKVFLRLMARNKITDFNKCNNIWDMQRRNDLAKQFYHELLTGNRTTYIYTIDNEFVGEISLVKEMNDADYTIPDRRIYVSLLIVKKEYRRQGIGRKLIDFIAEKAKSRGYAEISIGVDLDNYPALKLYIEAGFDQIIYIGEDEQGRYMKLLKKI